MEKALAKYRLKPVGENLWVVQERWFLFWCDCTRNTRQIGSDMLGPMMASDPHYVHSIEEGEKVIAEKKELDVWSATRRKRDAEFLRHNRPKEY